jgi:hypothetical protein
MDPLVSVSSTITATVDTGALATTIDALTDCAEACNADADADLSEHELFELVKCIRLCQDCADVCAATRNVLSRQTDYQTGVSSPLLDACVRICKSCGDECEQHAQRHAHSRSSTFDHIRHYGERRAGEADQWNMPANFPALFSPPRIQREQSHVDHLHVAYPRHRQNALGDESLGHHLWNIQAPHPSVQQSVGSRQR